MNQKKKKGLIALVILLVVAIGVGFATALTDTVTINGTANATTDFDIQFTNKNDDITTNAVPVSADNTGITVTAAYTSVDEATIKVSKLKHVGDYGQATFTVVNKSKDLAANITAAVSTAIDDADHYEVTTTMATGSDNVAKDGGNTKVTVKVKLIKAFADKEKAETDRTFKVTVTGTAIEE